MFKVINSRMSFKIPKDAIDSLDPERSKKEVGLQTQIFLARTGATSRPECIWNRRLMDVSHEAVRLVDEANGHVVHKN